MISGRQVLSERLALSLCHVQEADSEVISIKEAIQLERDVTSDWSEVLWPRHRSILHVVAIGLGLGFFQQASGSEAAVYYSPEILAAIGVGQAKTRSLVRTTSSSAAAPTPPDGGRERRRCGYGGGRAG